MATLEVLTKSIPLLTCPLVDYAASQGKLASDYELVELSVDDQGIDAKDFSGRIEQIFETSLRGDCRKGARKSLYDLAAEKDCEAIVSLQENYDSGRSRTLFDSGSAPSCAIYATGVKLRSHT